jgi:hypothetical protein
MKYGINTNTAFPGVWFTGVPTRAGGAVVRPRAALDRLVAFIRPHH